MKLATYLHLVSSLGLSGDIPPLPPYALIAFTGTPLPSSDLTLQNIQVSLVNGKLKTIINTVSAHVIMFLVAEVAVNKTWEI